MILSSGISESAFTWAAPPLKFGLGVLDEIGGDVASFCAETCLVITDQRMRATGAADRVRDAIAVGGIKCEVFDRVAAEPTDVSIAEAVLPGNVHDLAAAREKVLPVLRNYTDEMPGLADCGYEGAGHGILTPVKKPKGVKELDITRAPGICC